MRVAVIPALNEARTIGSVALGAGEHVDHVIVVDDGSSDATGDIASLAGAQVVRHGANRGKGAALRTGLLAALERGAEVVILLDGDGQHDPADIPRLVRPIERAEADLVIGARTRNGDGRARRHRMLGRRMLDRATNAAGGVQVSDTQSGYRAVRGKVIEGLLPQEEGMGVESEMLLAAARQGLRIAEVPVANHYPEGVRPHLHPARQGASVVASLMRVLQERHPLGFFGVPGLLMLGLGIAQGYLAATHYYETGEFWLGKAMLATLLMVLGSQAIFAAILLDFLRVKLRGIP